MVADLSKEGGIDGRNTGMLSGKEGADMEAGPGGPTAAPLCLTA